MNSHAQAINNTAEDNAFENKGIEQDTLRIPLQFKPDRIIEDGPFGPWVEATVKRSYDLTMEKLVPTQADLELISKLAYQTDDLGNNLAELILKDSKVALQLEQGLAEGIASLDNPPQELVDFLDYYENIPDWAFANELEEYLQGTKSTSTELPKKPFPEFLLDGVAMSAGFFVGANYPAVGQSIVATGSVASGTARMKQTMQYVDDMTNMRGFSKFGRAIQSNAKVRLAHAFARRQIDRSGMWDKDYYGELISDFDNMIFMSGLMLQDDITNNNQKISERAKQAMRLQTKAMQYLLGAPKELIDMSIPDTKRFFVMVVAHLDDSPETARQVVRSFQDNEYFRPTDTFKGKVSRELAFLTANMVTRVSWGNVMADDIGMDKRFWGLPLAPVSNFVTNPPALVKKLSPLLIKGAGRLAQMDKARRKKRNGEGPAVRPSGSPTPYKGSYGAFKS